MTALTRKLRHWLKLLERTPLHPQWLLLRHRRDRIAWINQYARGTLVDIGCGDAQLRSMLHRSIRYIGIDYPVTVALGYSGNPDILAEGSRLPIADASADTVLLLDVLEHVLDPGGTIAEAARILRPGGACLIHVPFLYPLHDEPHDYQRWTKYGLTRLLDAHGLEADQIRASTTSLETATALSAIALTKAVIDSFRSPGAALLLAPLLLLMVPLVNSLGWLLSRLLRPCELMPFSYRVLARR